MKRRGTVRLPVFGCARCSRDHPELIFKLFNLHPVQDEDGTVWDMWAICPVTGDPILSRVLESTKVSHDQEIDAQEDSRENGASNAIHP